MTPFLSNLYKISKKSSFVVMILICCFFIECSEGLKKQIIIDETHIKEEVVQTIKIDSVWAGHRVGFCLYTQR